MRHFHRGLFVLLLLCVLALPGCAASTAEDFYALPQLSDEYLSLQSAIDTVLAAGAEFSAPTAGANRQAVQLEDIDGDGLKEALVFLSVSGSTRPQRIYIFRRSDTSTSYEEVAHIEGEGTGIESVSYLDMDGSGAREIAVGWKIASGMNLLSVYSMRGFEPTELFSTDYTKYVAYDLDGNSRTDIIALRLSSPEAAGEAEMYSLAEDGEITTSTTLLSPEARSLSRVRTTRLADTRPAVLIDSSLATGSAGLVTNVLACRRGKILNVTYDTQSLAPSATLRSTTVWSRDIDGDGVLDVPVLEALPALPDASVYYMTRWYDFGVDGTQTLVTTTFMNSTDSWYLVLPDRWIGNITVRRQDIVSGERAVVFSYTGSDPENPVDFLAVYTLSGDNREWRAQSGRRFVLSREEERLYAASILTDTLPIGVTEELVRSHFNILYAEWFTSVT